MIKKNIYIFLKSISLCVFFFLHIVQKKKFKFTHYIELAYQKIFVKLIHFG